jgi:hypothetical protein
MILAYKDADQYNDFWPHIVGPSEHQYHVLHDSQQWVRLCLLHVYCFPLL